MCGTWPAFWTANLNNWPSGGEIDILEGVNQDAANHIALHTTTGCIVSQNAQTGTFDTMNCDVNAAGQATNAGCGGYTQANASYGDGVNSLGGGVFAVDWTAEAIRVYQFPRPDIPADILAGTPNPALWGTPAFDFSGPNANIPAHFNNHQIVFDTTFCGDWAGNTFSQCGCAGTCTDFVANHPTAFKDVYWGIKNLSVYKAS